jgi:hypothetical protein
MSRKNKAGRYNEKAEGVSDVNEDIGIVASSLKRAPRKVDALLPVLLLIVTPAGKP